MNFSLVRPWPHLKVTAKAESFSSDDPRIKPSPFADLRILAIRADEPTVGKFLFGRRHRLLIDLHRSRSPAKFHTRLDCVVDKQLMQLYAAHRKARCARKIRACGMFLVHKPDSTECKGVFRWQADAEHPAASNTVGQEPRPAELVNRGRSGTKTNGS